MDIVGVELPSTTDGDASACLQAENTSSMLKVSE